MNGKAGRITPVVAALAVVAITVLAGCSSGGAGEGDDGSSATSANPTTTTTAAADPLPVTLALVHTFQAGDGSGIIRQNDDIGTPCGISGLTTPADTLHYLEPGSDAILANAAGDIIAKAPLSNGYLLTPSVDGNSGWECAWTIDFDEVPASDFYTLEINGTEVKTIDADDLVDLEGTLTASVYL